jgi:hypothetical protein
MDKSKFERAANKYVDKEVQKYLIIASLFPFVLVGGVTTSFCDVASQLVVYVGVVGFFHLALLLYWIFLVRRLIRAKEFKTSKPAIYVGAVLTYSVGIVVGLAASGKHH